MARLATALLALLAVTTPALAAEPLRSGVHRAQMQEAVPPGEDFYRFANGRWLEQVQIPPDRSNYGSFAIVHDRTQQQLRRILERLPAASDAQAGDDTEGVKLAALYHSFRDVARIEALGLSPAQHLLGRIEALDNHADLAPLLAELLRAGVTVPIDLAVYADARHPDRYALYISQSGLGLPDRDFYLSDAPRFVALRKAYREHVARMLALSGLSDAATAAQQVLAFETRLAEAHWTRVASRDREATYNPSATARLPERAPGFDWGAFFAVLGPQPPGVILRQPEAIAAAATLLRDTALPSLRAYLRYHVLHAFAPYLSSPFDAERFAFHGRILSGIERPQPRWRRGLALVESAMGEALGRRYVAEHFPPEHRRRVQRMVDYLLAAYRQRIQALDWMGEATRAEALAKLEAFSAKIGHPDRWRSYEALRVEADDLFGNVARAQAFAFDWRYRRLGQPVDPDEWFMTPQTVNAYYSPSGNEIVFPAAILQPPFFDAGADDAINFGAIGGVIGHEIGHGFDDQGSRFDGEGRMRNWWTEADRARFEALTADLVAQYSGFCPLPGHCVNGELSLGENIGDLGGLGIAHVALGLAMEDASGGGLRRLFGGSASLRDAVIDGWSPEQRFFLGWAQMWARKYRQEELINRLKTGPHAPDRYRTNGVVRNIDAWYEAFDVQPGDALWLPPDARVRIW